MNLITPTPELPLPYSKGTSPHDVAILTAIDQAVVCSERDEASRANLKQKATLLQSVEHLSGLCARDMKATYDTPNRRPDAMKRRKEVWEALGKHYCKHAGLFNKEVKVNALNYRGLYALVLIDKPQVDGLLEVIKTAVRYCVFSETEVVSMYAGKQAGGMVYMQYPCFDAAAANDAAMSSVCSRSTPSVPPSP